MRLLSAFCADGVEREWLAELAHLNKRLGDLDREERVQFKRIAQIQVPRRLLLHAGNHAGEATAISEWPVRELTATGSPRFATLAGRRSDRRVCS